MFRKRDQVLSKVSEWIRHFLIRLYVWIGLDLLNGSNGHGGSGEGINYFGSQEALRDSLHDKQ